MVYLKRNNKTAFNKYQNEYLLDVFVCLLKSCRRLLPLFTMDEDRQGKILLILNSQKRKILLNKNWKSNSKTLNILRIRTLIHNVDNQDFT